MVVERLLPQFSYHFTYLLTVSPLCPSSVRGSPVHSEDLGWLCFASPVHSEGFGWLCSASPVHCKGLGWLCSVSPVHTEGHPLSLQGRSIFPQHLLAEHGKNSIHSTETALAHTHMHMLLMYVCVYMYTQSHISTCIARHTTLTCQLSLQEFHLPQELLPLLAHLLTHLTHST